MDRGVLVVTVKPTETTGRSLLVNTETAERDVLAVAVKPTVNGEVFARGYTEYARYVLTVTIRSRLV